MRTRARLAAWLGVTGALLGMLRVDVFSGGRAAAPHATASQETRAPVQAPPEQPAFESMTTAVLVDVVVRDRRGRIVSDLTAEEFELREDGALQTLGSFTRVSRGGGIGVNVALREPGVTVVDGARGRPAPDAGDPSPAYPAVTALVFDALSPDAVALCQRAALEYVPMSGLFPIKVGVFSTEPTVRALQGFTDDPALVRQAVRLVLPTGTTLREDQSERLAQLRQRRDQLASRADPAAQGGAGGASLAGNSGAIGEAEMQKRLVQGEMRVLQAFETLDRDQRGFGTTGALATVVRSLAEMQGRKTVVFFSEGLPASPVLQTRLQAVVEAANRVNVTIYAVDASGLRALSGTRETRLEVEEAGKERLRQADAATEPTEQPVMRILERTEDLLRFDSQGGLAHLAEGTGGILFRDTNNLRQALQRIDEDMRSHYLLTYVPGNQAFDGRFRTIRVRVTRPGMTVFARKGYRALRRPPSLPALEYETPALAALNSARLPAAFAFTSTVLHFPERGGPGLSPLIVRVKTDVLAYDETTRPGSYGGQATVVVRFRNEAGDVVEKVSQQYQLSGRLEELAAARRGDILFYREPTLPPGVYTVEAVVHDGVSNRASARVSTLEVPQPLDDRGGLSSIVLVRRTERVGAGDQRPGSPLVVGDLLFYPNAGEPVSRVEDRELTFFYTLYPTRDAAQRPSAEIELRRHGRTVAQAPAQLASADALGRIQQVSRLPLAALQDGTYELRVVAHAGAQTFARSAFFTVTP
jgi:VWFA-related protein